MSSGPTPRQSKRQHQPSAKASASSACSSSTSLAPSSVSRRSQRRRVPPSASTPVRGTVTSPASFCVRPNSQRRRLRAATTSSSVSEHGILSTYPKGAHDDHKVLGRYSSRNCALLCEVILSQLKKQTLVSTVLDEDKSPAFIRWEPVAKKMETTHRLKLTPKECQLLWKYLAYGQVPELGTGEEELLPDSDEEEFRQTPKEINARLAAKRAKDEEQKQEEVQAAASDETIGDMQDKRCEATGKSNEEVDGSEKRDKSGTSGAQEKDREPSIRLYPTYSLPTGAPDAWYRPFGPKDALPLTLVASRFLRRKPTPPPAQLQFRKNTAIQGASAVGTTDLKRKQAGPVDNSAEAAKKAKLVTLPLSTPPRACTSSAVLPPAVMRARSELEFFELQLREEQAKTVPGAKFALSSADVQRRFGEASAEVRRQCQTLAVHDIERFNRDIVRVRIREKAMGAGNTKPVASPSQTSNTKAVSTACTGTAIANPAKMSNPATAKSLIASSTNMSSVSVIVKERQDGGAALASTDTM